MAERALPDLKARLILDTSDLDRGLQRTGEVQKSLGLTDQQLSRLGTTGLLVGGALVAGFGLAVGAATKFEAQISAVGAVSGATGAQLDLLRQAALDAGAATVFSAREAAEAETELAKAGVSTADILGGALRGALDLAAAGNLGLAQAATIAANAMNTFGLAGKDVPHIADVLAAAANKSAADVDDMGQALAQAGLVADQFGLTLDETAGVLSLFAQAGLKGSDAGTSLKTALQRLVPQSAEAATAMKELGLDFFDAQGNFIGITGAAQELKDSLSLLSQEQRATALQTIFGADAIRAATLLYQAGGDGVAQWTENVNDSGFAAQLAAEKMDNLAGDLENLKGSIETALIQSGSKANGVLREIVQSATNLANGFGALPGPLQAIGLGFTGIGGAVIGTAGAIAKLTPTVHAFRLAANQMGTSVQFVAKNLGTIATTAGFAAAGILALIEAWGQGTTAGHLFADSVTVDFDLSNYAGIQDAIQATNAAIDQANDKTREAAKGWNIFTIGARDSLKASGEEKAALADLNAELDALNQKAVNTGRNTAILADQFDLSADKVQELADKFGIDLTGGVFSATLGFRAAYAQAKLLDSVGGDLGASTGALSGGLNEVGDEAKAAADEIRGLTDALNAQFDPLFGMIDAANQVRDAQQGHADAAARVWVAQDALNKLQGDSKATAEELADAQRELADATTDYGDSNITAAKAALNAQNSAIELEGAIRTGTVSVEDAKTALANWVAQGILTAEQAAVVGAKFDEASVDAGELGEAVDELDEKDVDIPVVADTTIPEENLSRTQGLADGLDETDPEVTVTAHTAAAQAALDDLLSSLRAVSSWSSLIGGGFTPQSNSGGSAIAAATGFAGTISSPTTVTMGEWEAEDVLIVPHSMGGISGISGAGGGGGDVTINVTVPVTGDVTVANAEQIGQGIGRGLNSVLARRSLAVAARTG